jgi:PKD repeat protein
MKFEVKYIVFYILLTINLNCSFGQVNSIPGLVLWLTGDSVETLSGNNINKCFDLSSQNNHAIQSTAISQPISVSASLNGHKTMFFDGVDDHLLFNEISTIRTVFWVVKENSLIAPNYRPLLGHSSAYDFHRGSGTNLWEIGNTSSNVTNGVTKLNFTAVNGSTTSLNPEYSIVSLVTTSNVKTDNFGVDRLIGSRFWSGNLAELIIYDQALTPLQVNQIEQYLNDKYAPPIQLPNDISIANSYCDTTIIPLIINNNSYSNFVWSTSITTPTLSVNKSGKYWINATNVFGKISSDTILVTFPTYNIPTQNFICLNDSFLWNANLPKNQYSFQWQDSSLDSVFNITQAGDYYVKITDSFGCNITSDTVKITVDNFASLLSLGPDTSLCSGNLITLTSGMSSSLTYTWSTGSNNDSLLITTTGQYSIAVTNTNNCIAKDTIIVTVQGQAPVADFTTSVSCYSTSVLFTDLSIPPAGNTIFSHDWNFGDLTSASNTSTLSNPSHTYTNTGTYTVSLRVVTDAGCEQTIIKLIQISPRPIVNFVNGVSRQNDSTAFTNLSTSTPGYTITGFAWDFGDQMSGLANQSNLINPKHLFSNATNYIVKLIATNQVGCKDSIEKSIHVISDTILFPNEMAGLSIWLTGDSVETLSGNTINKCFELSSQNNHAIQSIAVSQPISVSASLNGHKTMFFDGIDDHLLFNEISTIRTVFWVVKENSLITPNYRPLLGHSTAFDFHRGSGTNLWEIGNTNSNITNGITKLNFTPVNSTTTSLNPEYSIVSVVSTNNVKADNYGVDRLISSRFWSGNLAELIIYDQALTPLQVNQVEQYLNDKYAPPIQLPNDISILNSFCDTTIIPLIINNNFYSNFVWSTGITTPTLSVNKSGKYWVNATNVFGKISSDTIVVTFPNYNLPTQNSICLNGSLLWNTSLPKNQYSFQWQDNSPDSIFNINQAGTYYVKITDSFGCNITSDTLKITVDNFASLVSLGPDDTLCSGNLITLTQGMSPSLTYTWSTGSNNDSLLIINAGQYSVIVTNTNNCIAKDTIDIIIQGFAPTANFTTSIGCVNQTVSFADLSIPPSGNSISNYEWNFGDSASPTNTSTTSNPSHTYSNTGTYNVHLTVTTNSNCAQSVTKIINVYPVPTATFAIGTSCQNDSTAFLNQSSGAIGYSVTNSYWNFGDASSTATTTIISPKHMYTNASIYTVKLLVTNSVGCKDSLYKTVNVQSEVKANFTNGPACLNAVTAFQSTSIIPPSGSTTYSWNFPGSTATVANPIRTFTNSGVYPVTLFVDGTNGCTSTITKLVNVYLSPITSFSIQAFCAKDTTNIINLSNPQSGIISSYNWKLNNITFSSVQSPTLSLTNPGNNSVRLTTINSFGCKDSTTNSLIVFPLPVVDFSTTPAAFYYINEPINFTPSINNASSYLWNMNATSTYSIQNLTETFNTEGSFNISLNLKDQNGCKGSKTKNITINERYLDLAVLKVNTNKDNNGFMTVVADIANYGSVPINSFKMGYQISDGGTIKETWNGTLNPNSFYTFTFNAESASTQNSVNNITCVEIEKVNTSIDDNTTNNSFCNSLNTDDIYVGNPLPNPTDGDIVLPITLNKDIDFTISIYNSVGKIQYEETTKKGIEGLNFVKLNTSSYARGAYIIKLMIDEKIFIKKFIKISYE